MNSDTHPGPAAAVPAELCFDIRGTDLVDVLCRTLDQVRRMGIRLNKLSVTAGTASIELIVFEHAGQLLRTLAKRIGQMKSVMSVDVRTC